MTNPTSNQETEYIYFSPDSNGCARESQVPEIWEELDEIIREHGGKGLKTLDAMDNEQKRTLMVCAVNDSKWVSEAKMDPNVQDILIEDGTLTDCIITD